MKTQKHRPRINRPRTADEVFKILREFMACRGLETISERERERLWDVLSALRGPDNGPAGSKSATTMVIRHAVFGMNSKVERYADVASDDAGRRDFRITMNMLNHFEEHVRWAFQSLGLKWDEINQ